MNRWSGLFLIVVVFAAVACAEVGSGEKPLPEPGVSCTDSWERFIEENVPTGDGQGHGPDLGSDEWQSVVEFRLGIRGKPGVPARGSAAWCQHIDQIVQSQRSASAESGDSGRAVHEAGPSVPHDNTASKTDAGA